tara:strand:- start:1536 stop:1784 length:249 start_codon:yes stop_codon:yes gene_type:complete
MKALRKQWVLDIQWSDMEEELGKEAMQMWRDDDRLSNDVCISKFSEDDWYEAEAGNYRYPKIFAHIKTLVPKGEEVWIHWWW